MFIKSYGLFAGGLLAYYGMASFFGWEVGTMSRESAQQSTARHASGGHRSVWISSYRGGK